MRDVLRHLWRRRARTALTTLAVAVGIFAVVAVGSLAENLDAVVIQPRLLNARGRIAVEPKEWDHPLTEATLRRLRRVEGVAAVMATITDRIEDVEGVVLRPLIFAGTRSDILGLEYESPLGVGLAAGRVPAPGSLSETVVSWDIAQEYGLQVGDVFPIRDHPFRVVGIWKRIESEEYPTASVAYEMAERLATDRWFSFPGVGRVAVVPLPGADPEALAARIRAEVDGVEALSPQEAADREYEDLLVFVLVTGASGVMALLIGSFTIINTMTVTVHERRGEIGLKKALGAADAHILAEYVAESAVVATLGGLLGVLAGGVLGLIGNQIARGPLGVTAFALTPRLAAGAMAFSLSMGSVAGLYPAWRAARLDPVVALRGGAAVVRARPGCLWRLLGPFLRNVRTLLTVVGIAIGVFALVVLGSLAEFAGGYIDDVTARAQHQVYVRRESNSGAQVNRSTARLVRRLPGVREVVLTRWGGWLDEAYTGGRQVSFYGIESPTGEYGWELPGDVRYTEGRFLRSGSSNEVVVGAALAQANDLRIGSTLTIEDYPFTVVGIRERDPLAANGNYVAHISLPALGRILGVPDPFNRITALVAPGHSPVQVAREVDEMLPGIETMTSEDQAEAPRRLITILFSVMAWLLSIAIFVGSVSVVNTVVIAVRERTPEIGLKKAVGAENADILAEVLIDAAVMGAAGGLLGLLAAIPVALVGNLIARGQAGFGIFCLTPRLVIGAVLLGTVLGMLSGLLPAWRAGRMDPVVALRTE